MAARLIVGLVLMLASCANSGDSLVRECVLLDRDVIYTQTQSMWKMECRR